MLMHFFKCIFIVQMLILYEKRKIRNKNYIKKVIFLVS